MSNILQNIKMKWELMTESPVWTAFSSSNSPAVALPLGQAVLTPTPFDVFVLFITAAFLRSHSMYFIKVPNRHSEA